ncbi:uncharacterized protein LODBEIA_P27930 [Lodderomyces beijingensis]|uniref:Ubiquitin thioesterase OTU n=1 Tax=Lodderomyces beijingensis TaxID=1775926 RepID=A0ABP0ZL05_9ASCO
MRLKLKSDSGVSTLTVDQDHQFADFILGIQSNKDLHADLSEVVASIKTGFPPKPIDLSYTPGKSIKDKGINDGDQLIVQFASLKRKSSPEVEALSKPVAPRTAAATTTTPTTTPAPTSTATATPQSPAVKKPDTKEDIPSVYMEDLSKYLILRNIPDDNSCLFNSISYAISGADSYKTFSPPSQLRSKIVDYIESDPELYSDLILGRPRKEYCGWIVKPESWGGAIELGILADWFDVRITCVDIESSSFIRIENELKKPTKFIVLIYSGIHYDVVAANAELNRTNKEHDQCMWSIDSETEKIIIESSKKLCKLLRDKDYSTNTTTFRVRCLDCYSILIGEVGASKHAEQTGHLNFGEVKKR